MGDRAYCRKMLQAVSRTFSIPIGMLRPSLEDVVTCAYLLCRIVDTIEDHASLSAGQKDRLFRRFLEVIEDGAPAGRFTDAMARVPGDGPELTLARRLPRVLRVLDECAPTARTTVARWVGEMARGMAIYCHRPAGEDGLVTLTTLRDLERYCYFVAGTVGQMLTDLFVDELEIEDARRVHALRATAEEFGLGLQLVNVLKDITDDQARGWSFVPRLVCAEQGLGPADLVRADRRRAAHAALEPLFERADRGLEAALEYSLAIPPAETDVRLFCLLPLWMAVRTLVLARGNDAQLIPERAVKIDRAEVASLIAHCRAHCADDEALRASFAALHEGGGRGVNGRPHPSTVHPDGATWSRGAGRASPD